MVSATSFNGEILFGESLRRQVSPVQKLAYDNHIANVDLIYAGDVLILKRDGQVPRDYSYKGSGRNVAQTSININYTYQENNTIVIVNNTSFYEDNHIEHNNYPRQDAKAGSSISDSLPSGPEKGQSTSNDGDSERPSSNGKSTDTDSGSETTTLEADAYQDAVQDELNTLLEEDNQAKVNFLPHTSEDASQVNELTEKDLYTRDESLDVKNMASTQDGAKAAAKAIYKKLQEDGKLSDLTDALKAKLSVSIVKAKLSVSIVDKSEIEFNVTVYNETKESTEESSSSSSSSDDSREYSDNSKDSSDSSSDSYSDSSQTESFDSNAEYND